MILKPSKAYYNIDPVSKETVSDAIYDGYLDANNDLYSRFGFDEFADTETAAVGDGLFWWDKIAKPYAVSNGRLFTFDINGTVTELTDVDFAEGTPVIFAPGQKVDNSGVLIAVNGNTMNYTTDGTTFTQIPANAPQTVSHVVYNGLRWIANETGTSRFYFSDVDPTTGEFDPLYWDATENPLTDDNRGDNITGLFSAWDDLAVWGQEGRSIWQVTGGSPPLENRLGAFCEAGLVAPYSVKKADNTFFALCRIDEKISVVRLAGNDPIIISEDIEQVLDGFETSSDAIGDVVSAGGQSFYILTFPTEDQTWAYNIKRKEWYQWSYWNQPDASRQAFLYRHFIYIPQWGFHLCQSRKDGKIYKVNIDGTYDGSDKIRCEWQTGWVQSETYQDKILASLRLKLKRAQGTISGNEPKVAIRWRDSGRREWKVEREVSLGKQGQYEFYRVLHGLGMFRSRQFSIIMSDPAKLILVGIEPNIL